MACTVGEDVSASVGVGSGVGVGAWVGVGVGASVGSGVGALVGVGAVVGGGVGVLGGFVGRQPGGWPFSSQRGRLVGLGVGGSVGPALVGDGTGLGVANGSKVGVAKGSKDGEGEGDSRMNVASAVGDGLGEAVGWTKISSECPGVRFPKSKMPPEPGCCGLDR